MYNTSFILSNGKEIYPGYLSKEKRKELKEQYGNERNFMWCGCKSSIRLYYRLSEDLKIYPEHNNYVHDSYCCRFKTETGEKERKTAYVVNDEDGEVTAYLSFDPRNMVLSEKTEKEENNQGIEETEQADGESEVTIEKDEKIVKECEKKEPKLTLSSLIRSINIDTFTEKIINDEIVSSKESFSKYVYVRMKKVRASRMKKSIGELSLEKDGVKFIYLPFSGAIKKDEKGLIKCYFCTIGVDGKTYNNFIFPETMKKAVNEYVKTYRIEPNSDTILAGFQYLKKTRSGVQYKVLGRVHLFQTSNLGIYCRSLVEKQAYDSLCEIVKEDKDIKFWIPADDESVGGIIEVKKRKKKILLIFRSKKDERIVFNELMYETLVVGENEPVTKERLYNVIKQMD